MQQLSGLDSVFLALESDSTPMHVSGLLLYQGVIDGDSDTLLSSVRARFAGILEQFPILRQRISDKQALLDDYPYWIDDERFNLDQHVQLKTLPQPGDWTQLRTLVSRLHEEPVHLKFPLWDAYVIDGLVSGNDFPDNSFAVLIKVHHAAIDGASMVKVLEALHSQGNTGIADDTADWLPQPKPRPMSLYWKSYGHQLERRKILFQTLRKLVPIKNQSKSEPREKVALTQKFTTRFNKKVTIGRTFDSVEFELDEIKRCKDKVEGATINDVVVSIVGGGLRHFLNHVGELTHESLVTGAPINIRDEESQFASSNQISMMRITLGTHIADPIDRLIAVKSRSKKSKNFSRNVGLKTLTNLTQSLDPSFLKLGVRAATSDILSELINTPVHTIVSNVPGPREPFKLGGADLMRVMALGPLIDQMGLFNAVTSYNNALSISFVSSADMLPEPERYAACLRQAYDELCNA